MMSKEVKKEYGYRISQALDKDAAYIQKSFSFREKIEIANGLSDCEPEFNAFKKTLEEAIYNEMLEGISWAPVYMEKRGGDKFVRCVRIQGKVKTYVRMEPKDFDEIEGPIYVRQDDFDDKIYAEIGEDARKRRN